MMKNMQNILNWILAVLMLIFGLNKFFGFIPVKPPADATAQSYMATMFTTYLFVVVAVAEIVGGILLIIPRTKFIGWLILLPVIFNIVAFHIAHDFIGNGIWLLPSAIFIGIGYFHKEKFQTLLI